MAPKKRALKLPPTEQKKITEFFQQKQLSICVEAAVAAIENGTNVVVFEIGDVIHLLKSALVGLCDTVNQAPDMHQAADLIADRLSLSCTSDTNGLATNLEAEEITKQGSTDKFSLLKGGVGCHMGIAAEENDSNMMQESGKFPQALAL